MPFFISPQDVLYAAVLALIFTWVINTLSKVFNVVITRSTEFDFQPQNLDAITRKCYSMFPTDIIKFNGATFKRGMRVKVLTSQHKTIEGQFIGINHENMVCFITKQSVVAQELDKIKEINPVEG